MSYAAKIIRIKMRPHPNADKLQLGDVDGHQVVVGLDTADSTLGVFFPTDGQLSHDMCVSNGLYSKEARIKLGLPVSEDCGFFSDKRRVRAQSFRGEKSDGFWCPLSYLSWTGAIHHLDWANPTEANITFVEGLLAEGMELDTLNGHSLCNKYETPATKAAKMAGQARTSRKESFYFPRHDDTKQFRFVSHRLPREGVYYVTEKLHGTSGRFGYVLEPLPLSWWQKAANRILAALGGAPAYPAESYKHLNGSKNVILERQEFDTGGYYGSNQFRYEAIERLYGLLHPGEVVYFEIVGYIGNTPIMPPQPIKPELKDARRTYGESMHFHYGCIRGEQAVYVYKIIQGLPDGTLLELPFQEVQKRCAELGLQVVPLLAGPIGVHAPTDDRDFSDTLQRLVDTHVDGSSLLDSRHIREGVVLRVESTSGVQHVKHKSWLFGVLEGYIKDTDTYVDREEIA